MTTQKRNKAHLHQLGYSCKLIASVYVLERHYEEIACPHTQQLLVPHAYLLYLYEADGCRESIAFFASLNRLHVFFDLFLKYFVYWLVLNSPKV